MFYGKETAGFKPFRSVSVFLLCVSLLGGYAGRAFAHARSYVFNQEYQTLPKGTFEIESHTTLKVPRHEHSNVNAWNFQEELEYGVTDHLNLANYQVWERQNKRNDDDITKYAGFFWEAKYRIGEKGKYGVDPLLYFEYKYDPRSRLSGAAHTLESKIILSKDFGKWNAVYNQVMESKLGEKGRTDHKFTAGLNYEVLEGSHVGIETKVDYWRAGSHRNRIAVGPTIAYEHKYFWIAWGIAFGVNHHADDYESRISFGVPF